jgi:SAM-dependent methyltransferase
MAWLNRHFRRLDDRYHGPEGDAFAREELQPVARRFLPAGGRVLEVGCGYGRNLVALAALPAGLVAGADPAAGELARARERLQALPAAERTRVALVRQEPFRLPLRDGSFDLVVLWQVLEHVLGPGAKQRLLTECLRVLRPGGHLLVETPNLWFPVDYHDNKLPFVHWTGAPCLREWITWRVRGMRYAPSEYVSLPGLERLLRRAAPGARCVRATRLYFADGFAGAWRGLGGTQVGLKRAVFAVLAPAHALLSLCGSSADLLLPSLRVVWRVEKPE